MAADLTRDRGAYIVFTVAGGILTTFYLMLTAEMLGGLGAAAMAGVVSGFGLLDIYMSCTGSSYPADSLATPAGYATVPKCQAERFR